MESLKIRILNGKLKGFEVKVQPHVVFSRDAGKKCVYVKDAAASNPHAKIVQKGQLFYLQDMDSKNGTYVEGELNDLFPLKPDLVFHIGHTHFQVVATKKKQESTWEKNLAGELKKYSSCITDNKQKLVSFQNLLCLRFLSGVQKSEEWFIGYGPRYAGKIELDLTILDPEAPDQCFSLHPQKGGEEVLFKTTCPNKVLLNQKHIIKQVLKNGDLISLAKTAIEVHFNVSS